MRDSDQFTYTLRSLLGSNGPSNLNLAEIIAAIRHGNLIETATGLVGVEQACRGARTYEHPAYEPSKRSGEPG